MKRSRYVVKAPSHDGRSTLYYNLRNGIGFKVGAGRAERFEQLLAVDGLAASLQKYGFLDPGDEADTLLEEYQKFRAQAPLHLVILPHQNCNFRCVYCYEKFDQNQMLPEVEAGLMRLVEERMRSGQYGGLTVSWFGGEPLLAPAVIDRLSEHFQTVCTEVGARYSATITTNGYFLNETNIDMLLRRQVVGFQVTIDGTEAHHDRQRVRKGGQPTYARIVENLERLSKRAEPFRMIVRMNVGPENLPEADGHIVEMKRRFGADKRFGLYFHNIGRWGGEHDDELEVCSDQVIVDLTHRTLDLGMTTHSVYQWVRPHATCYAASPDSFVVGADGTVYKCTVALYDEVNKVGRLLPDGQLELAADKMALWTGQGVTDTTCKSCFYAPTCHGDSCPLERIRHNKRPCPPLKQNVREVVTLLERSGHPFVELEMVQVESVQAQTGMSGGGSR